MSESKRLQIRSKQLSNFYLFGKNQMKKIYKSIHRLWILAWIFDLSRYLKYKKKQVYESSVTFGWLISFTTDYARVSNSVSK